MELQTTEKIQELKESISHVIVGQEKTVDLVLTAIIAWWKNNSFTQEAIEADKYLDQLRATK